MTSPAGVDLYWIPLGAGAHVVRVSGALYEALMATIQRRPRSALYHSTLVVSLAETSVVIEMTPVTAGRGADRGVVAEGPVGMRWLGRFRLFRYEIHCWRNGVVADLGDAIGGPIRVTEDPVRIQRILDLVPSVPTPVWGRDELSTGDMWNSNSVVAWLLAQSQADPVTIGPPRGGRAPGWDAGLAVADRDRRP
jgi:hypothetical protein